MNPEKGVQDVAAASGKSRPVYWPPISPRSRILIAKDVLKRYHAGIGRDFGNNAEHQLQERKKMAHGGQMRFGLWYDFRRPEHSELSFPEIYQQTLEHIRYAEQLGIDDIWLSEHHFIEDGYLPSVLATAAAIAAITKNVAIGTNVLLLPFHHPVTVAEEAAVVDIISGGRFYGVRTGEESGLQDRLVT